VRDTEPVQNLELYRLEWRRDLVFDDLDPGLVANDFVALLYRTDATDIQPDRRVKFQRVAAGGRLRATEHDADLHANLVDEKHDAVRPLDVTRQLAQRL